MKKWLGKYRFLALIVGVLAITHTFAAASQGENAPAITVVPQVPPVVKVMGEAALDVHRRRRCQELQEEWSRREMALQEQLRRLEQEVIAAEEAAAAARKAEESTAEKCRQAQQRQEELLQQQRQIAPQGTAEVSKRRQDLQRQLDDDKKLRLVSQVLVDESGVKREYQVLWLGIHHAYAVNTAAGLAGIFRNGQWQWNPQWLEQLALAIDVAAGVIPPQLVELPL